MNPKKETADPTAVKEVQSGGSVGLTIYKAYFKSVDNCIFVAVVLLLFVLAQGFVSGVDYFITLW